ncbi:MAG: hypothetical protein WCK33_03210 [Phycisphaerae bacterium]
MGELLIPVAIDPAGVACAPEAALAGVTYRCPACLSALTVRSGGRRTHFAHRAGACSGGEAAAHRAACAAAAGLGSGEAAFETTCAGCSRRHVVAMPPFDQAVREFTLPGGLRADVAFLEGGRVRLVVEVRHGNALDTSRMDRMGDVAWIEVAASEVLGGTPPWRAMRSRGLWACAACLSTSIVRVRECWNCGAEVGEGACGACGAG